MNPLPVEVWDHIAHLLIRAHRNRTFDGLHCVARFARTCQLFASIVRNPRFQEAAKSALAVRTRTETDQHGELYYRLANGKLHGRWDRVARGIVLSLAHYKDGKLHGTACTLHGRMHVFEFREGCLVEGPPPSSFGGALVAADARFFIAQCFHSGTHDPDASLIYD